MADNKKKKNTKKSKKGYLLDERKDLNPYGAKAKPKKKEK